MFYEFKVDNKIYNLKLTTKNIVSIEKQLGCNPLMIFGDGTRIPTVTEMITILHSSLQAYNHGIAFDDAYTIFDKWIEDNHTMTDFIPVILEIYKASGIIKNSDITEKN